MVGGLVDFMFLFSAFSKSFYHRDHGLRNAIFATNFSYR